MIHLNLTPRATRAAMLLAMVALLMGTLPVHAASSVAIDVRALVGGRYEVGGWLALSVTLVNEGEPTDGYLSAASTGGSVRRFVELPAGSRKVVSLYVQPEAFQRSIAVRYEEPNGSVSAEIQVGVLEQSNHQFAVVGDGGGTLRPQLFSPAELGLPEPITLSTADIPERPEPLDGLAAMVWAGDSATLSEPQRRSLVRWISDGGQLVVLGGADWQARAAGFAELLPLDDLTTVDEIPMQALAAWSGADEPALPEATVSTGTLRDDARTLVTADDGTVLASMRSVGAGHVVLIGADLATDAFRVWEGSPGLWARVLPTGAMLEQWFGGGVPVREEIDGTMSSALQTLPTLDVPPAELLLAVIVGYILLIGPISYLVLRRVDRRELAWVTAPILVVLFSACSYGIGRTLKGSDVVVNQISVVRTSEAGGAATIETYAGIFSPERRSYDVTVDADALLARLTAASFDGQPSQAGTVIVEQGNPARLRDLAIGVFGFERVRAAGVMDLDPALSVAWRADDAGVVGTVTNEGDEPLSDVAYVSTQGGERIGDLAPGASAEFTVSAMSFNGSSAADQVYGFAGFAGGTDEQRQINLRRQVISALVGQGGFSGTELSGVGGRGPYLIGWRDDPGPLPVAIEETEATRYESSVEVLSVRPFARTGSVTIRPLQANVTVMETVDDAQVTGPGQVSLGDGSVTFGISLPLEATGLAVTGLDIVLGWDPSMLLENQDGMGGFYPEGFIAEVRDPISGEWTLLGDMSRQTRFEIAEPDTMLSSTGRIDVRVTGTEVDPNIGQQQVFASMEVTGVIDE